jgi:upstream activation factor subunit UAF30
MSAAAKNPAAAPAKPNALQRPLKPSPELAAIIGDQPISRSAATATLWRYIKTRELQDPADRRQILADDTLRPPNNGRNRIGMLEVAKLLNRHLAT